MSSAGNSAQQSCPMSLVEDASKREMSVEVSEQSSSKGALACLYTSRLKQQISCTCTTSMRYRSRYVSRGYSASMRHTGVSADSGNRRAYSSIIERNTMSARSAFMSFSPCFREPECRTRKHTTSLGSLRGHSANSINLGGLSS
jgi:hypothetical protein